MTINVIHLNPNYEHCTLTTYVSEIHQELPFNQKRKAMLVMPGGGYGGCSRREAEQVALTFVNMGFNAFVLDYVEGAALKFPEHLKELCAAIKYLKDNAEELHINPEQIYMIGFSAGAHLTACLGTLWNRDFLYEDGLAPKGYYKPHAMILGYPVLSSGEFGHRGSFENLLKDNINNEELMNLMSLEKQVSEETVPAYIWHTADDPLVPVENSLLFCAAMSKYKIPFELHVFQHGPHGMSLCDPQTGMPDVYVGEWVQEVAHWVKQN